MYHVTIHLCAAAIVSACEQSIFGVYSSCHITHTHINEWLNACAQIMRRIDKMLSSIETHHKNADKKYRSREPDAENHEPTASES